MKSSLTAKTLVIASLSALLLAGTVACSPASGPASDGDAGSAPASEAPAAAIDASSEAPAPAEASSEASSPAIAPTAPAGQELADEAREQGYEVFFGTVHVCTPEELIELQGLDIEPEMVSHGGTYAVLVFDAPTEVTGMLGDGSGMDTREATMLGLAEYTEYDSFVIEYGDLNTWQALDGQEAVVKAMPDDIGFPSDVRLPTGEPAAKNAEFIF